MPVSLPFGLRPRTWLIIIALLVLPPIHVLLIGKPGVEQAKTSAAPAPAPKTTWHYSRIKDEMRGTWTIIAMVESENYTVFDMRRYNRRGGNGATKLRLNLLADHNGENIYLSVEKGIFDCSSSGCEGTIVIDGSEHQLTLVEPEDDSTDTLFVSSPEKLIPLLRKAAKIGIELPFYKQGRRQFSFSVTPPLNWPPAEADFK